MSSTPLLSSQHDIDDESNHHHDNASSSSPFANPKAFFGLFVGHCQEWPEQRDEQGDEALYRAYVEAGVPREQLCYLKDDDECTRDNCQAQLQALLDQTQSKSSSSQQQQNALSETTLVFYYGGHGVPLGFDTCDAIWTYREILETIANGFGGQRVLFLLDCCASGNLLHHLSAKLDPNNLNYVALCNAAPYVIASDEGDEWILNKFWMQGMRQQHAPPSLAMVTERISDRLAQQLGNQLAAVYGPGVDAHATDWMPRRMPRDNNRHHNDSNNDTATDSSYANWSRLQLHIPTKEQVTAEDWTVGDSVFYKHVGGNVVAVDRDSEEKKERSSDNQKAYVPPGWYFAQIIAENNDNEESDEREVVLQLRVCYDFQPPQHIYWRAEAPRKHLLSDLHMRFCWMLPKNFEDVQVELAQHGKYLDYSFGPPHSFVQALNSKGTWQSARLVDWRDFDWDAEPDDPKEDVYHDKPPFGPHVPLQWITATPTQEQQSTGLTLVSIEHIRRHHENDNNHDNSTAANGAANDRNGASGHNNPMALEPGARARHALLQSLHSSGKRLCHARDRFPSRRRRNYTTVYAYWPEDGQWYRAQPLDPETVLLEILASHAQFAPRGLYCPLAYEDGAFALSPLHYVRADRPSLEENENDDRCCRCCCVL